MDWIVSGFTSLFDLPKWYLWSAIVSGYILYYLLEVVKKPVLACSEGRFKEFLDQNVPLLHEKFWPTIWCIESRAQTLIASFVRSTILPHLNYRREIFTLKDGGDVCLDWLDPVENCPDDSPTVIILPGLTGHSQAEYVRELVLAAKSIGLRAVVFNQRGIGGIALKTPRTYCASNVEDLVEVVAHVSEVCKGANIAATGVSMGGLLLGNYLASIEGESKLTCAMLISVPWNVPIGTESIETPIVNLMLNRHLTSCLCNILRNVRHVMEPGPYAIDEVLKSKTIREFDTKFTVKQFGYKDVDDYYSHASLHDKVRKIKIPVLCLSSADDPFQPFNGIPVKDANENDKLAIIITSRGGHIGFMEGIWPLRQNQYMFKLFSQFFDSFLIKEGFKNIIK